MMGGVIYFIIFQPQMAGVEISDTTCDYSSTSCLSSFP